MQSNKMLSKHHKECCKFVSHVKLKMASIKPDSSYLLSEDDDSDFDIDPFESDDDEQDDEENDTFDESIASYSFGRRWYYWEHYKDGTYGKYVERKYNTFKNEIMNNTIYSLTIIDWNAANDRAKTYNKCGKAKAL
eukprot:386203_1